MKSSRMLPTVLLIGVVGVTMSGCSWFSPYSGLGLERGELLFYSNAKETTPEITASGSRSPARALHTADTATSRDASEWSDASGNPLYAAFNLLREFDPAIHEGVLDRSNLYKLLYDVGNLIPVYPKALENPLAVESPFDFGNPSRTYTYGNDETLTGEGSYESISDYAMNIDGDKIEALVTYVWREGDKFERGVFEAELNAASGDVNIDFVHLVLYPTGETYSNRAHITGNQNAHTFTVKYINAGVSDVDGTASVRASIVGTGVSKSEDASDYFLLKILTPSLAEPSYYFCPAGVTEDEMRAYDWQGSDLATVDDPSDYATIVDGMAMFTIDDAILSEADFTGGSNSLRF